VNQEENDILSAPFTEEEIKAAINSCYAEGGPGQMASPSSFFQKFWEVVKKDIVNMCRGQP
jgi:hypothetical protein